MGEIEISVVSPVYTAEKILEELVNQIETTVSQITDKYEIVLVFRWMTTEMLESLTPTLLGDYPNTYTFTKGLAEFIISKECGRFPVTIVRPSIITGSCLEPFPVSFLYYPIFPNEHNQVRNLKIPKYGPMQ